MWVKGRFPTAGWVQCCLHAIIKEGKGLLICDPFWENPYKRGHQLFLFVFTYRIYGARGPRLPSLTEITQVFFELWIKTFMHNRSIIISRFRENANASLWPRGVSRFYVY